MDQELTFCIHGHGGMVANETRNGLTPLSSGPLSFYVKDHLGSTRVVLASGTGTVEASYDYSPFGEVMRASVAVESRYTYTGQESDGESGLMNYHARLYDPSIGRFGATDPAGQFNSPYAYVGNNPVSFSDPSGEVGLLAAFMIAGAIQGAVFGGFQAYLNNAMNGGGSLPLGKVLLGAGRGALGGAASGAVSFGFTTTGAFGIAEVANTWSAGARNLAAGALQSATSSIAGNIGSLRSPFSRVNVGIGSFSLTLRDGSISTHPFDHLGNIATLGNYAIGAVGTALSSDGSISFHKGALAPIFSSSFSSGVRGGSSGVAIQGAIYTQSKAQFILDQRTRTENKSWPEYLEWLFSPQNDPEVNPNGNFSEIRGINSLASYGQGFYRNTIDHEATHIVQNMLGGGFLRQMATTDILGGSALRYFRPPYNPFEYSAMYSAATQSYSFFGSPR